MRNLIFLLLSLLVIPAYSFEIDSPNRIKNQPPGYCLWASLEALGRQHKIEPLYDLLNQRTKDKDEYIQENGKWILLKNNLGYQKACENKLNSLKIKYQYQSMVLDHAILKHANDKGVIVVVKAFCLNYPKAHPQHSPHAIVLLHYDDTDIKFYDCNFPQETFLGKSPKEFGSISLGQAQPWLYILINNWKNYIFENEIK